MKLSELHIVDNCEPKRWWAETYRGIGPRKGDYCGSYYLGMTQNRRQVRAIGLWPQSIQRLKGPPKATIDEAIYAAIRLHLLAGRV